MVAGALFTTAPAQAGRLIGFTAPWDPASAAALRVHGDDLAAVVPARLSVYGADHAVTLAPDPAGDAALAASRRPPPLWLLLQNARSGQWDGAGAGALLHDPQAAAALQDRLVAAMAQGASPELVIDFEALPPNAQPALASFLGTLRTRLHQRGNRLAVTVPAADPAWNLPALGAVTDRILLMAYDEHWQTGKPGPIASNGWFRGAVAGAAAALPRGHLTVALAAYAYDWPADGAATVLSVERAQALAAEHGVAIDRDPSGGSRFGYALDGVTHQVWIADAAAFRSQAAIARSLGVTSLALWRLGTEDPQLWAPGP